MKKMLIFTAILLLASTLFTITAWAALTQTQVSQLYVGVMGRASEGDGNRYWQTDPSSTDLTTTAGIMLDTPTAKAYFGDKLYNNRLFIEHIYLYTFGKTYADDPNGIDYWIGELDGGYSKARTIHAIITAVQHPDNADSGQARFLNRVAVSNYCADNIATFTDQETFEGFISSVTNDLDTTYLAKGQIDDIGDDSPTTYYQDSDEDGYGDLNSPYEDVSQPTGYVTNSTDCDDFDSDINPEAIEVCSDSIDQDCNGSDLVCELEPVFSSISISGPTEVDENSSAQYTCNAIYSDGSTKDVTSSATWSEDSLYATISSGGLLATPSVSLYRTFKITATFEGKSFTTVPLTIINASIATLSISGPTEVDENSSAQYTLTAKYEDGSTEDVTSRAFWKGPSFATINSSGILYTSEVRIDLINGRITATFEGKPTYHFVTIKNTTSQSEENVIDGPLLVDEIKQVQFRYFVPPGNPFLKNKGGDLIQDVTNRSTWTVNSDYATISRSGLLTTSEVAADSTVTITATFEGESTSHLVTIKDIHPPISYLEISGPTQLYTSHGGHYYCIVTYSDGTIENVSYSASWSEVSSYNVPILSGASGFLHVPDSAADGMVTITAAYGGKSTSSTVTIKAECTPGSTEVSSCSISNGTGKTTTTCGSNKQWSNATACLLTSCNSGYTKSGNKCVKNYTDGTDDTGGGGSTCVGSGGTRAGSVRGDSGSYFYDRSRSRDLAQLTVENKARAICGDGYKTCINWIDNWCELSKDGKQYKCYQNAEITCYKTRCSVQWCGSGR